MIGIQAAKTRDDSVPEPGLTADEMIGRAVALRDRLVAEQAATEQRGYYSQEIHEEFLKAGFYHLLVPKRYGGYEFDVPIFVRVVQEISRGCMSTGWCLGLAMSNALLVASWWPEEAQDEIFAGGPFRASAVTAPVGEASLTAGGWEINGQVSFASGTPYATHFMGHAMLTGTDGSKSVLLFVAPRSGWEMLDDWGDLVGLKGSGSHSIRFNHTRIPESWGFEAAMTEIDVTDGTPGAWIHDTTMYSSPARFIIAVSIAAVCVGGAYNALDAYEELLRSKCSPLPPFGPRVQSREFRRWFGRALTKISFAEAAMHHAAAQHVEFCRRNMEDDIPYTWADDELLAGIAREVRMHCWDVVNRDLWQTMGASAARDDARITRLFRDMALAAAHRGPQLRDFYYSEIGRGALGEPQGPLEDW